MDRLWETQTEKLGKRSLFNSLGTGYVRSRALTDHGCIVSQTLAYHFYLISQVC